MAYPSPNSSSRVISTTTAAITPLEAQMDTLQIDGSGGNHHHGTGYGRKRSAKKYHARGMKAEDDRLAKFAQMVDRGRKGEALEFPSKRAKKVMMGKVRFGATDGTHLFSVLSP